MAKAQTKLKRMQIGLERFMHYTFLGCRPTAIMGRLNGPRVIMNSIPKSGTNLLNRALMYMPKMRQSGVCTIRLWGEADAGLLQRLSSIRNGQYVVGHIQDSDEVFSLMMKESIKGLVMIRDPRMIVLSHLNYVTNIDKTHKTHKYFESLPSDEARLNSIIQGVDGVVAPIGEVLRRYEGWLRHPNVLTVKFEDLVGSSGGGTQIKQQETIKGIAEHLGIHMSDEWISAIADKVFSSSAPTFRSGSTTGWKEKLSDDQKAILKPQIADWLIKYGYEVDQRW